ncbi:hypothetical protein NQ314_003500 [Rhamnusium bicolor]|uniref:Protein SHQ1 homolog n=1 Tax=Rhamnusium bicolor TaxID=1586634 RepID=A0AAV8ZLV2_9CUCU|nr:hypothetical protein NQ314_003500 [Rhamnusium bicolor]
MVNRLNLPGNITENDNIRSSYDSDSGEFSFCYEKLIHGEDFKDLELITKYLVTKVDASYDDDKRKITVLTSEGCAQEILPESDDLTKGFGFGLLANRNFVTVSSEFYEVFEISPNDVNLPERRKLRLQYEQGKFDMGHYLGDFIKDEKIIEITGQKTPWNELQEDTVTLTNKELDFLKELTNTEYKLNDLQVKYVFNGLIALLAYCYDRRVTFYVDNSESGWTIVKLSASLCWLDAFETARETLICAFRRSVIYPLYRNCILSVLKSSTI